MSYTNKTFLDTHIKLFIKLICFYFISCSTQKDKYLNRQYHSINTKYNVLFNGEEAFLVGKGILSKTVEDNFFELLPIEPIAINGENLNETTIIPGFSTAEEKAVKAIQKHSININGLQRNKRIDQAYLLLGKARYFDRRFFPALEAFNFLLENYVDPQTYVEARIWREKTNIRLRNNELAIKNLRTLAREITPKSSLYGEANASIADAFIQTNQIDSALIYLKRSVKEVNRNALKARYLFITGQLYGILNHPDSSLLAFKELTKLNRKTPRKYLVNAQINQLNLDWKIRGVSPAEGLKKISAKYENKNFNHWIYRALGLYYLTEGKDSLGVHFLDRSLHSEKIDFPTKQINYRDFADFYFNKGDYVLSGKYLDSLIKMLPEFSLESKTARREKNNLANVITYEGNAKLTDSILAISSLSEDKQIEFFKKFIENKKAKELDLALKEEKGFKFFSKGQKANQFYFYNTNLLIRGKQKFQSFWGDLPNVDNWRVSSKVKVFNQAESFRGESKKIDRNVFIETPENYVKRLPKTPQEIDSLRTLNFNTYLQLGMIYKESFKNLELAKTRLETLLSKNPPRDIEGPAIYHLFKINEKTNPLLAKVYRERIIKEFNGTAFERILTSPENFKTGENQGPEAIYKNFLRLYKKGDLIKFLEESEEREVLLSGTKMESKFEFLKANVIGRLDGIKFWNEELEKFQKKYPETPEASEANRIIAQIKNFTQESNREVYKNYKWILPYRIKDSLKLEETREKLYKILGKDKKGSKKWFFSKDLYNREYVFLVLHGIKDIKSFKQFKEKLTEKYDHILSTNNFVALSSQYRELLKNKNWNYVKE